jgi:magnesium-transporting ATPase (P-type)
LTIWYPETRDTNDNISPQTIDAPVSADLLILNGNAFVIEALFNGESIAQRKGPLDATSPR